MILYNSALPELLLKILIHIWHALGQKFFLILVYFRVIGKKPEGTLKSSLMTNLSMHANRAFFDILVITRTIKYVSIFFVTN